MVMPSAAAVQMLIRTKRTWFATERHPMLSNGQLPLSSYHGQKIHFRPWGPTAEIAGRILVTPK